MNGTRPPLMAVRGGRVAPEGSPLGPEWSTTMSELERIPQPSAPAVAAGWHPWGDGMQRYFDGRQWTDHYAPLAARAQLPARAGGGTVAAAWIIAVLTLGYMLPWAVAAARGRPNHGAIALLNLFTGWTLVGWIAALVMACV